MPWEANVRPVTVVEREYLQILNEILVKKDWHSKIYNDAILEKWRLEISQSSADFAANPNRFNFLRDELYFLAKERTLSVDINEKIENKDNGIRTALRN